MRKEEDRRADAAAYEAEMRRLARLEQMKEPEPEGITPEQMEYIRDARTKLYWIYKTRNMKELEVADRVVSQQLFTCMPACLPKYSTVAVKNLFRVAAAKRSVEKVVLA
jgi:hypothetical protein